MCGATEEKIPLSLHSMLRSKMNTTSHGNSSTILLLMPLSQLMVSLHGKLSKEITSSRVNASSTTSSLDVTTDIALLRGNHMK